MIKEKLAKLIDLKSIITILIISVLCYLVIVGKITADQFLPIVTMIVTFYYAHKSNKEI